MDDKYLNNILRSKDKIDLQVEGWIIKDKSQQTSKKQHSEIQCNLLILRNTDHENEYVLAFYNKKGKKMESIVPLIAELQFWYADSISFEMYWDGGAYTRKDHKCVHKGEFVIPASAEFKMTFIANSAQQLQKVMKQVHNIKFHEKREKNTFAYLKTHTWLWHFKQFIPPAMQQKPTQAVTLSIDCDNASSLGGAAGGGKEESEYANADPQLQETLKHMNSTN
jgi:hypothetical protein